MASCLRAGRQRPRRGGSTGVYFPRTERRPVAARIVGRTREIAAWQPRRTNMRDVSAPPAPSPTYAPARASRRPSPPRASVPRPPSPQGPGAFVPATWPRLLLLLLLLLLPPRVVILPGLGNASGSTTRSRPISPPWVPRHGRGGDPPDWLRNARASRTPRTGAAPRPAPHGGLVPGPDRVGDPLGEGIAGADHVALSRTARAGGWRASPRRLRRRTSARSFLGSP